MHGQPTGTGSDPQWALMAQMGAQSAQALQVPTQVAKQQQTEAMQSSLTDDTLNLIKMFGQRAQASGASLNAPFTSTAGGFATPFLTPIGGMVGLRTG